MKIEPRGKYAGVKVHLDGEESQMFLDVYKDHSKGGVDYTDGYDFAVKLGKKISKLVGEMPNLLEDRTEEQIKEALTGDAEKIEKQLKAMAKGADWKKVK